MFGFGKKKTPARTTSANRAAATKSGKAKPTTATRTKAKCTVCRQRRQVDTANKICGRHQCANVIARRLDSADNRRTKKSATRKTPQKKATPKPATPAASSRKKTPRTAGKLATGSNISVDKLWHYRCQTLEIEDELLRSGELTPNDTEATKKIAAHLRGYSYQQFAAAYRTDRKHYEAMSMHIRLHLTLAQTALKSIRAAQAARAAQR